MRVIFLSAITSFFCYSAITHKVEAKQKEKEKEKAKKEQKEK
jgi:phosphotransferase system  glucose/maltose/N-acetylglucosamine-specific IIC component